MNPQTHAPLVALIWRIADDCLRDIYNRGKYRDVILPMTVLRRLDALLEDTKAQVLAEAELQREQLKHLEPRALQRASGYLFFNTSPWTLKKSSPRPPTRASSSRFGVRPEALRGQ